MYALQSVSMEVIGNVATLHHSIRDCTIASVLPHLHHLVANPKLESTIKPSFLVMANVFYFRRTLNSRQCRNCCISLVWRAAVIFSTTLPCGDFCKYIQSKENEIAHQSMFKHMFTDLCEMCLWCLFLIVPSSVTFPLALGNQANCPVPKNRIPSVTSW